MTKIMKASEFLIACLLLNTCTSNAAEVNEPAPSCPSTETPSKLNVDPGQFTGKVLLIDFWATWCPPCVQSIPFFNKLRNELGANGFEILAVNVDEDKATVDDFLQSHPIEYPVVFDPNGECPKTYDVKAMPSSYLLDKTGKIRKIFLGFRDSEQATIKSEIQHLLSE